MSDVLDIARGFRISTFGVPAEALEPTTPAVAATPAPHYLRLALLDKPGVLAKVTAALGDAGVSIDRMRQYGQHDNPDVAPVLIVTDPTSRRALNEALTAMEATGALAAQPVAIRIEDV